MEMRELDHLERANMLQACKRINLGSNHFLGLKSPGNSTPAYGVENLGPMQWESLISLAAVYLICYFSLWKGVKMSGKVVWFTALFPYAVLFVLFLRGITLPGATEGIEFYLRPNITKLYEQQVWSDAATQVFFSLGPGFGVLLAYASYNPFHNNIYNSIIFFTMLVTLGLDSSFGGSEAIITALSDEWPVLKKHREAFIAVLFGVYFMVGTFMCTSGGYVIEEWTGYYGTRYGLIVAVFCESIVISWIYGLRRFKHDIVEMMGKEPAAYWCFAWKFLAPSVLAGMLILLALGDTRFPVFPIPDWFHQLGMAISLSSVFAIPLAALYQLYLADGDSILQKLSSATTPWKDTVDLATLHGGRSGFEARDTLVTAPKATKMDVLL